MCGRSAMRARRDNAEWSPRLSPQETHLQGTQSSRSQIRLGLSVGNDFDPEASGARAVEFAEENALPAAEFEFASADENGGAGADERGLYVGIGVPFAVLIIAVFRDQARERG